MTANISGLQSAVCSLQCFVYVAQLWVFSGDLGSIKGLTSVTRF